MTPQGDAVTWLVSDAFGPAVRASSSRRDETRSAAAGFECVARPHAVALEYDAREAPHGRFTLAALYAGHNQAHGGAR